jgi:hypothetical protein
MVVGKMPPRKTLVRKSPKKPRTRGREPVEGIQLSTNIGRGATDYKGSRINHHVTPEEIIYTGTSIWRHKPSTSSTSTQVHIPGWNSLFIKFKDHNYLESTPHSDPDLRVVDDQVFQNIRCSRLHLATTRAPVFPCIEAVEWIINHTNCRNCVINNEKGECIGVFLP